MNTAEATAHAGEEDRQADADVRAAVARAESRAAIESLLGQLGYPADWAGDMERQAWKRGHVWREVR